MDPRVSEFHCIMPMVNIPSVLKHGILSYERTAKVAHASVAMQPVQDRRDVKRVPGGLMLHRYANLYFHARNPMMFKRQAEAPNLCVLRVSTAVAKLSGVVFADRNASSDWVRFLDPSQWAALDFDEQAPACGHGLNDFLERRHPRAGPFRAHPPAKVQRPQLGQRQVTDLAIQSAGPARGRIVDDDDATVAG